MIFGFCAGSLYLYMVYDPPGDAVALMEPWLGLDHLRFGIVGMAVSLVAMVAVTLMTPEPDAETQAMVDEVRVPTGPAILSQTH
jgi:cation/acetate symporter